MLGSIFFKFRYALSRPARLTILWASLFGELLFVGIFVRFAGMESPGAAVVSCIIAPICMIFTGPILTLFFKVGQDNIDEYAAGRKTSGKEIFGYIACLVWFAICTGLSVWILTSCDEMMVHYWVLYYIFALFVEFLLIQLIKAAIKYQLLKPYENKEGSGMHEHMRQT
jgi:hypothetical protein